MNTASPATDVRLAAQDIRLGYTGEPIIDGLSVSIPSNEFTVILGPNACGKSTLLRALGRLMSPRGGNVVLDGKDITSYPTKEVARRVGLLPQSPVTPEAVTVGDLVARGRFPHQRMLRQWSADDENAVESALVRVGMREFSDRMVDELSGGQRQRVWIAMVLAQDTPILLLDEPTTFLDVVYQLDVLDLCAQLHTAGSTIVAVLHDLNMASRYASNIIAMRDGGIVAQGDPTTVLTPDTLRDVFGFDALVIDDPETGRPLIIPRVRTGS